MQTEQRRKCNIAAALALALTLLCACETKPAAPDIQEETPPVSVASVTPSPTPVPTATPEPRAERVEDDYFADAAFFGNSLVDGLHSFGGLAHGTFFAGTSASVISVESIKDTRLSDHRSATMLEALLEKQYAKIYVLLGINELGFNVDGFVDLYAGLLEKIQEGQPQAQIFVMSLTPITEQRSSSGDLFTQERVQAFNAAIKTMADAHGYIYLDLFTALSDNEGFLPEDHSTDGVHFTADTYLDWAEYLRRNYDGAAEAVTFYKEEMPDGTTETISNKDESPDGIAETSFNKDETPDVADAQPEG